MGFLDDMMGQVGGAGGMTQLTQLLGNGGLQQIVGQLQSGGLEQAVTSWIGTGANLPISSDQLHNVLGSDTVTRIAQSLGVDSHQVAGMLPDLINHLTPNGQLPHNVGEALNDLGSSGALGSLLGGFLKT